MFMVCKYHAIGIVEWRKAPYLCTRKQTVEKNKECQIYNI